MDIKILDSWLRDFLKTKANPEKIGEILSATSVSVDRIEKSGEDFVYDIEVTTNRPDLASVTGIAREAAAALNQHGIDASYEEPRLKTPETPKDKLIEITSDPKLVNRLLAVAMEVEVGESPKETRERLEKSGTRSLNNVIDVTNYVMKEIGHPTHVFDLDRLNTKTLTVREAKSGETIETLDNKKYVLRGGEIVAVDDNGRIVDLLGIMGLENSVVTEKTKRILYFINTNEPTRIRKASMSLGIRTEAAVLNEKNIDSELAYKALLLGVELFEKNAKGKIISEITDIYSNKVKEKTVSVRLSRINKLIGIEIEPQKALKALKDLGFEAKLLKDSIDVVVPSFRLGDIEIEEDLIEEIARLQGYENLPNILPPQTKVVAHRFADGFYWEKRVKQAFKYWGFTEVYTYSFVSTELFEGPLEEAVEINNPLNEEFVYMRKTLVPSLLKVVSDNKEQETIKIFEIANVYHKRKGDLPQELLTLAGVVKKEKANFYEVKGLVEQLLTDLGIKNLEFKSSDKTGIGASLYVGKEYLGEIEILDNNLIDFELNFELILKNASLKKIFKPLSKFPPIVEDLSFNISKSIETKSVIDEIKSKSKLITEVELMDQYDNSRTFHIVYQDPEKNLTTEEVSQIREKIISDLKEKFGASLK